MKIVKVIEVIASSDKGFSEAIENAVKEAAKTVKNIESVYVQEMKALVKDNSIISYGVNAKISFVVES